MNCCGFGNRKVYRNIDKQLYDLVIQAIQNGCNTFYTGYMGDFDLKFCNAVKEAKKEYKNIELICVRPYLTKELQSNKDYYYDYFDCIIIPPELSNIHYKQAITERNKWIVNHSDIVIGFSVRKYGGAITAISYATKQNKTIYMIDNNS